MNSHIPASVQPLLQDYLQQLQAEVPDLLLGLYIHGSIAYGAFCEQTSDIDVLAVTVRVCSAEDLARLGKIHADLRAKWPQWKLEVSYVPKADCSSLQPGTAPPHPYHQDREFVGSGIFDFNSPLWAANLWWMVKTRGITLLGPEPSELGIQISTADIVATSRYLVENYWPQWARPRGNWFKLRQEFYWLCQTINVDWVVFGTLRTYYTLREHDITSKPDAAEYGLAHLPKRWHKLIRETLENRRSSVEISFFARVWIAIVTALYLRFILRECRRIA